MKNEVLSQPETPTKIDVGYQETGSVHFEVRNNKHIAEQTNRNIGELALNPGNRIRVTAAEGLGGKLEFNRADTGESIEFNLNVDTNEQDQ